jgi:2-iminobutanoate/2-iminopropanoate deaminase
LPVGEQTRVVLRNLQSTLEAAGSSLQSVVRTTIYVADLADYPAVNDVYKEFFREPFPARATIEVKALIGGLAVEIDAIGLLERGTE